jgi:hypothetical protein
MPPRTLAVSVLMLSVCLLLAVVILATLSAQSEQPMVRKPPETVAGEPPGLSSAEPCEETAPRTEVADVPPDTAGITQC